VDQHFAFSDSGTVGLGTSSSLDRCCKSMECAGLCSYSVVTMHAHKCALDALNMMQQYDVSAVAIVDEVGRLLGHFSTSEMRSIMAQHFGALALPVAEFLALSHGMDYSSCTLQKSPVHARILTSCCYIVSSPCIVAMLSPVEPTGD
jgi:CBS-domain-containing membrane protein